MGYGDELMALGRAQAIHASTGCRVAILSRNGRVREHPLWREAVEIVTPDEVGGPKTKVSGLSLGPHVALIKDGGGCRPYIDYTRSTPRRWVFKPYRPQPARLGWLRPARRDAGRVMVHPDVKFRVSPNKRWKGWQRLVDLAPDIPWAQAGPPGTRWLDGVEKITTATFEDAVNALAGCRAAVLPEGGLHHAAAAVGVPAVVLFGAFVPPTSTGYDMHVNLAVDEPSAAGWRVPNVACAQAWTTITPETVLNRLRELL